MIEAVLRMAGAPQALLNARRPFVMASISNVILGSAAALLVWTCIGLAVARAVLPQRALWWPVAPALGWAVHSAAALPLFMLIGFNRITVTIVTVLAVAAAAYALWRQPRAARPTRTASAFPLWAWIGALCSRSALPPRSCRNSSTARSSSPARSSTTPRSR